MVCFVFLKKNLSIHVVLDNVSELKFNEHFSSVSIWRPSNKTSIGIHSFYSIYIYICLPKGQNPCIFVSITTFYYSTLSLIIHTLFFFLLMIKSIVYLKNKLKFREKQFITPLCIDTHILKLHFSKHAQRSAAEMILGK